MTTATPTRTTEGITTGDIFVSTWGYDQTNVDFLRVTRVTNTTVTVEPVTTRQTPGAHPMTYTATPGDTAAGPAFRRTVRTRPGRRTNINGIASFTTATPWDGTPVPGTSYA